jgi:hypothetical protein
MRLRQRNVLAPMRQPAPPCSGAAHLRAYFLKRLREDRRQQFAHDLPNGFLVGAPIKLLAARGPMTDDAVAAINDDVGAVQDAGDLVEALVSGNLNLIASVT